MHHPANPTVEDLAAEIDRAGQTDTILLDFSKAFDKVLHQRLLSKMEFVDSITGRKVADNKILNECLRYIVT